jgi:hypothetical protein
MIDEIDFSKWRAVPPIKIQRAPTVTLQSLYDDLERDGFVRRIDKLWGSVGCVQVVDAANDER